MKRHALTIHTDGGARGNPGPAAYGFVVTDEENKVLYQEGKVLGETTNNVAEYSGVFHALAWVVSQSLEIDKIHCFLDSELVVRQLTGVYKIKNENLRSLYASVKQLEEKLNAVVTYTAVPRTENKAADALVNQALDNAQ